MLKCYYHPKADGLALKLALGSHCHDAVAAIPRFGMQTFMSGRCRNHPTDNCRRRSGRRFVSEADIQMTALRNT